MRDKGENIFYEKELDENSVVKENLTTAKDGKNYKTKFYNLDLIQVQIMMQRINKQESFLRLYKIKCTMQFMVILQQK